MGSPKTSAADVQRRRRVEVGAYLIPCQEVAPHKGHGQRRTPAATAEFYVKALGKRLTDTQCHQVEVGGKPNRFDPSDSEKGYLWVVPNPDHQPHQMLLRGLSRLLRIGYVDQLRLVCALQHACVRGRYRLSLRLRELGYNRIKANKRGTYLPDHQEFTFPSISSFFWSEVCVFGEEGIS